MAAAERIAARVYRFHVPVVRKGKRYASLVVRLFDGRQDRYGNRGPVAALELHVDNLKEAVRDGVVRYDKETGRASITIAKAGPDDLRRLAQRLMDIADALELAAALGVSSGEISEAWRRLRAGGSGEAGGEKAEVGELDLFD